MAVTTTVSAVRTLTVLALAALLASASACSLGSDDTSAKDREKLTVDAVVEAVPLVEQALGASEATVAGGWSSCPGGVGHVFSGGATLVAEGKVPEQLEAARSALTDAGFELGEPDERSVSAVRDEVDLTFQHSPARGAGGWKFSFSGPCKRYGGDDADYVDAESLKAKRTLLP